jgi:hypothetical protein
MTWYTASVLISIKPEDYTSGPIQVYENMYLVEASTADDAIKIAEELGRQEGSIDDDGLTIDGKPATRTYEGIRKLISISNPVPFNMDGDPPTNGTEVTYALYQLADESAVAKLASGEEVEIVYIE